MRRLWLLALPVIGLMLAGVVLAQNIRLKPVLPVSGRLDIFDNVTSPHQFLTFDTRTGAVLFQRDLSGTRPMREMTERWIAFTGGSHAISILYLNYGTVYTHNFEASGDFDYLYPVGWSVEGDNLLYLGFDEQSVVRVYFFDAAGKLLSPALKTRTLFAPVTDVTLPGVPPDAVLTDLQIMRNPVYNDWVAERSTLTRPLNPAESTVEQFIVYDFWNYDTGEYLFLSNLLPQINADGGRFGWSPDGTLFYYPGYGDTIHDKIAHIVQFDAEAKIVTLLKSARIDWQFISFLGVDDLLLTIRTRGTNDIPEEADTTIYSVSQIIDGEGHNRALFKIAGAPGGPDEMNFTLMADTAERHALACLFVPSCPDN